MIQLKVYPTIDKVRADQLFLDLYDTQPIKLTLSIEDITDADATSVFSRTFKVPATRHNNEFFKTAFEVDGVDYDVTIKKPAEILVDGQEFRQGHIRLQKIYTNQDQDKIDYELLFLGETRDFSTVIGDATLCQLVMPDLQATNASGTPRNPNANDIILSWQAFPEGTGVDANGNPNSGLSDGNIIYPLVDHGNQYDDEGELVGVEMSIDDSATSGSFTKSANPLPTSRLKPMIRAKRIWDQIFADAGYTYTSDFIDSARFHQMYVSAFGNDANIGYSAQNSQENLLNAEYNGTDPQYFTDYLYLPDNVFDPGGNFTVGNSGMGSYYTAPATAVAGDANVKYRMVAQAYVFGEIEVSCPGFCTDPVAAVLQLVNISTGQVLKQSPYPGGYDQVVNLSFDTETDGLGINAGDNLALRVMPIGSSTDFDQVTDVRWQIQQAPGVLLPSGELDCEYKQIDFIKDVLKMFRLVLAPDRNDTKNFIVEPWQTYINSGNLHDWSHKLIQDKDQVLEPLFNTQAEEIEYSFQEDEDYVNVYHQEQFKHPYGWLKFDSNNELLKGSRKIETIEIAPTPLATIREVGVTTSHQSPGWIFPQIHANEADDPVTRHLPIKAKTRFVFYNGLADIPQPSGGGVLGWYLAGSTGAKTNYPLVSSFENWPQTADGLNLNWANDVNYWSEDAANSVYNTQGKTLFSEYWSRYIQSLYGKFSRRLTAYFTLNNVDLQDLSFDDTIFVNGTYYRPEKIIDVQIGERTAVKCQLITANDYKPAAYIDEQLTNFSVNGTAELCGCDGIITVSTDGATPFTWELSNGQTGQVETTGPNPQQFDIENICAGSYNVTITDDLGRSNTGSVTIGASTVNITATYTITDATNCVSPCNGQVTSITPSGGSAPYSIEWQDGGTGDRTDLCPGTHPFIVRDNNGCVSEPFEVLIECAPSVTVHKLAPFVNGCNNLGTNFIYASDTVSYAIGTIVDVNEFSGCYQVVGYSQETPNATIANNYSTCADCTGVTPPQIWKAEAICALIPQVPIKYINAAANPGLTFGQVVQFSGDNLCYKITELTYGVATTYTPVAVFTDCAACEGQDFTEYIITDCDGFSGPTPAPTGGVVKGGTIQNVGEAPVSELYLPDFKFADGTNVCEVNGLSMTAIQGATSGSGTEILPAGWYYFRPRIDFVNLVTLPSDTVLSLVRIEDIEPTIDFGNVIEILESRPVTNLGAGQSNTYQYTSQNSYYMSENGNQRFGLAIHRDPGGACVQGGGTNLDFAIDMSSTPFATRITPYYLGEYGTGIVMQADTPNLNVGDVVQVEGDNRCWIVQGQANPNSTADYTYDVNAGVFADCLTCTGGYTGQYCTTVAANAVAGCEISYVYDNGTGNASYTETLTAGQVITICAADGSIQLVSGTQPDIVVSSELCFKFTDPVTGTIGTTCDTPTTPNSYCYEIEGVAGPGTTVSKFEWFLNNVRFEAKLRDGETQDICADENTVQNVYGDGNITGGTVACTSDRDCQPLCYEYLYEGPRGADLLFYDCDGVQKYIRDVTFDIGPGNVLPYCISVVIGGRAVPFMSQYQVCT